MKKKNIRFFKEIETVEELRNVIGNVTISFAISPETKYLLQLYAKKLNLGFSELCRQLLENKTETLAGMEIVKPKRDKAVKTTKKEMEFNSRADLARHYWDEKKIKGFSVYNSKLGGLEVGKEMTVSGYQVKRLSKNRWRVSK